jgi:hypothetical protein
VCFALGPLLILNGTLYIIILTKEIFLTRSNANIRYYKDLYVHLQLEVCDHIFLNSLILNWFPWLKRVLSLGPGLLVKDALLQLLPIEKKEKRIKYCKSEGKFSLHWFIIKGIVSRDWAGLQLDSLNR